MRRAARQKGASAQVYYNLAMVLKARGTHEQVGQWLRRAVQRDPRYGNAWFELGQWAVAKGDYRAACEAYGRVLDLEPKALDAARALVSIALRLGDWEAVARACALLPKAESETARYKLAAAQGSGGFAQAAQYLRARPGDVKTLTQCARGVMPFCLPTPDA